MDRNTTTEKRQHLTGVWQNGGRSAKLSISTSINISAELNIRTSNPPLRQAPERCNVGMMYVNLHENNSAVNQLFITD